MLINGKWQEDWQPIQAQDEQGGFVRQCSSFRDWITPDGTPGPDSRIGLAAEAGRFHLYVGYICPWASRTIIARALKGLESVISLSFLDPVLTPQGWHFGRYADPHGADSHLYHKYIQSDAAYTGRATIPLLWDMQQRRIVNNESADILRILNSGFGTLADNSIDLYPAALQVEIDQINTRLYHNLNNGVYRAGFASTQAAYDAAVSDVFATLNWLEQHLAARDWLAGDQLSEADIRLFVTLIRFDAAYYSLFKCNQRRIKDFPVISQYLNRLMAIDAFAKAVNISQIKEGYYSIGALNPTGIVPAGPLDLPFAHLLLNEEEKCS